MKKVGFFGGTFDPIHHGHLHLAIQLLEAHGLDQVLFCPAHLSPGKEADPPIASAETRLKLIKFAIAEVKVFSCTDIEVKRGGVSYTVDTLRELIPQHPKVEFFLLLGEDTLKGLPFWKEPQELLKLARPLVGTRPGQSKIDVPSEFQEMIEKGRTPIPPMEISSTDLRKRLSQKKYCSHLVPAKVLDTIWEERVY